MVDCVKQFEPLSKQADSSCRDEHIGSLPFDVNLVECNVKALGGNKRERKLRVAAWNFSGLGSERKQKEVEEVLAKIIQMCCSWSGVLGKGGLWNMC